MTLLFEAGKVWFPLKSASYIVPPFSWITVSFYWSYLSKRSVTTALANVIGVTGKFFLNFKPKESSNYLKSLWEPQLPFQIRHLGNLHATKTIVAAKLTGLETKDILDTWPKIWSPGLRNPKKSRTNFWSALSWAKDDS